VLCPCLSTAVGGTGLYRNRAICRGAACTRAGRNSMTADDDLRNSARKVFEIAHEELFIDEELLGKKLFIDFKIGDADIKYKFPNVQTNSEEEGPGCGEKGGVPLRWVECLDGALVLFRLGLLVLAVCSVQERSGPNKCFTTWAGHNRTYRNKWFKLALLALLVPWVSAMAATMKTPPDGDGTGAHHGDGTGANRGESAESDVHTSTRPSSPRPSLPPLLLLTLTTPPPPIRVPVWVPSPPPPWSPLMALPCTVLPCTEASKVPGLYQGLQLAMPKYRRELQIQVSTSAGLTSALANTAVCCIVLASGTYYLSAELSITRSVILEAAVAGSVILNAHASSASSRRRVLNINPGSTGAVQLIGLNITGGYLFSVRARMFKSPHRPHGKLTFRSLLAGWWCLCLFRHSDHLIVHHQWEHSLWLCASSSSKVPNAPMGNSRFARCLQGGGVLVYSGTVMITSSSIYGNTAGTVRAHLQKSGKCLADMPNSTLAILPWNCTPGSCTCQQRLQTSHRPMGKLLTRLL